MVSETRKMCHGPSNGLFLHLGPNPLPAPPPAPPTNGETFSGEVLALPPAHHPKDQGRPQPKPRWRWAMEMHAAMPSSALFAVLCKDIVLFLTSPPPPPGTFLIPTNLEETSSLPFEESPGLRQVGREVGLGARLARRLTHQNWHH